MVLICVCFSKSTRLLIGVTIVCATNEGLYANYKEVDNQRIEFTGNIKDDSQQNFSCPLDINALKQQAQSGSYFCYVAGTAAAVLESKHFKFRNSLNADYKGILIDNYETSLPMKKGLSSSAAVCVLVAKCFSDIYSLNMSHAELMEIAYLGEKMTSSECGRMDQCVVMGKNSIGVMRFDGSSCELVKLKCKTSLYFVVVDLKAGKDTVVILRDLNACFTGEMNENKVM